MISSRREQSLDLTIFTGTGSVQADDVIAVMKELYSGTPTNLVLWDLTDADVTGMEFEGVQEIARLAVEHGRSRVNGKTAIITDQQVTFGIDRLYQSFMDDNIRPVQVQVFWTLDEALEFLGIDSLPAP